MVADEQDYFTLLVASERVRRWLDIIASASASATRKHEALLELAAAVEEREAYAEEARRAGAVRILTRLMANTDDDAVLDAVSTVVASCSGLMAAGNQVRVFQYGNDVDLIVHEGPLGDGLGSRVWLVAHLMARELALQPALVKGRTVLELGSGCGVTGMAAAKAGALLVTLTDVEHPVLRNLRDCMHANAAAAGNAAQHAVSAATCQMPLQRQPEGQGCHVALLSCEPQTQLFSDRVPAEATQSKHCQNANNVTMEVYRDVQLPEGITEKDLFDCDSDSDCSGVVGQLAEMSDGVSHGKHKELPASWEAGNMCIRILNWDNAIDSFTWSDVQRVAKTAVERMDPGVEPLRAPVRPAHSGSKGAAESQHRAAGCKVKPADDASKTNGVHKLPSTCVAVCGAACWEDLPPAVAADQQFDIVLATDCVYESPMAYGVAATVKRHLSPSGRCMICNAVRFQDCHDLLVKRLAAEGLVVHVQSIEGITERAVGFGALGARTDYEGGFVILYVEHVGAAEAGGGWQRHYTLFQ